MTALTKVKSIKFMYYVCVLYVQLMFFLNLLLGGKYTRVKS